jgi:hypothetical protein
MVPEAGRHYPIAEMLVDTRVFNVRVLFIKIGM